MNIQKFKWDLINYYVEGNKNFLTTHQIDSYNGFISTQLPKTIRQFSPIKIEKPNLIMIKNAPGNITQKYNQLLSIYLGGHYDKDNKKIINDGSQFFIGKPIMYNNLDNIKSVPLYPNLCRLKNITYCSMLFIDIILEFSKEIEQLGPIRVEDYLKYIEETNIFEEGTGYKYNFSIPVSEFKNSNVKSEIYTNDYSLIVIFKNIPIGIIPIMLHSNKCILYNQSKSTLIEMGECPYNQGGYFIIDGKEKVIIAQERQTENKIFISKLSDTPFEYKLEIRSSPEDKLQPARITNLVSTRDSKVFNSYNNRELFDLYNKNNTFYCIGDIVNKNSDDSIKYEIVKINININNAIIKNKEGITEEVELNKLIKIESTKSIYLEPYISNLKKIKPTNELHIKKDIIRVIIPNIEKPIPLFILFRALGLTTDKEIIKCIVKDDNFIENKLSKIYIQFLKNTIIESSFIQTQKQAFIYLISLYKKEKLTQKKIYNSESIRIEDKNNIMDILINYFIPHIRDNLIDKYFYLGHMVRKFINVILKIDKPTDRDSYMYKRIDISGYLMATLYRDLLFRFKNDITYQTNIFFNNHIRNEKENKDNKLNIVKLEDKININNIHNFFRSKLITDGIIYAFKNCWGMKNSTCKEGIVQDLNIISTLGTLSNLRRINTPLSKSSKMREPHSLHGSSWGIMCPVETPDGGNVGLRKNLAIMAHISFECNSNSLESLLINLGVLNIIGLDSVKSKTIIFLNERIIGVHPFPMELVKTLKLYKRNGLLNIFTSICWNILQNEIKISTDSGRSCRPLIIREGFDLLYNQVNISPEYIRRLSSSKYKIQLEYQDSIIKNKIIEIEIEEWNSFKTDKIKLKTFIENHLEGNILKSFIIDIRNNWEILLSGLERFIPEKQIFYGESDNILNKIYESSLDKYNSNCISNNKNILELTKNQGIIEYLDVEEENNTMIAFNYGDLIDINHNTKMYKYCEINSCMILGLLANMIPFPGSNQAPRNLFSGGQTKQAIGVFATNYRNRMDTKSQILLYPQKPIIDTKLGKLANIDKLPFGQNAIVAIACYSGYNQDDSIIMNKNSLQRGLFNSIKYRTYVIEEEDTGNGLYKKFRIPNPQNTINIKSGNYSYLQGPEAGIYNGVIREGVKVNENDVLIGLSINTKRFNDKGDEIYEDSSLFVKRNETGIVDKVYVGQDINGNKFCKIRIRKDKIPIVGDKFSSRHGQKGVIGIKLDQENMPFTEDGLVPDMIINPQAFPKRMTCAQFIETLFGKCMSLKGTFGNASAFERININDLSNELEYLGYEKYSNELLYNGIDGNILDAKIFIGPTYYMRLQHQVEDKMYSRGDGGISNLTHQPVGGRALGGGLRIGEMERDAILSHGISTFLKETMMERSDKYSIWIDNKSGLNAIVNKSKKISKCFNSYRTIEFESSSNNSIPIKDQITPCRSGVTKVELPYAMKLFLQEMVSLSIAPRIITKNLLEKWKNPIITNYLEKEEDFYYDENVDFETKNIIKPLSLFHNRIKDILLAGCKNNIPNFTGSLIDFSVGQGGDISKWYASFINENVYDNNYGCNKSIIIGIDKFKSNIKIAQKRLNKIKNEKSKKGKWAKNANIQFFTADTSLELYSKYNSNKSKDLFPNLTEDLYKSLQVDEEGLFSITKPYFNQEIVNIINILIPDLSVETIIDGNGGIGGDTIGFSKHFKNVFTYEINRQRCDKLKNNVKTYKLTNVNVICGELINDPKIQKFNNSILYFDPPWGGKDWKKNPNIIGKDSAISKSNCGPYEILKFINSKSINVKLLVFKLPSLKKWSNMNSKSEVNKYKNQMDILKSKFKNYKILWKDIYEFMLLICIPIKYYKTKHSELINEYKSLSFTLQNYYRVNTFDISCSFYSIHYYLENQCKLENLFKNVQNSLRQDGFFLVTGLDGNKILNKLKGVNSLVGNVGETTIWEIKKNEESVLPSKLDTNSFGIKIDVMVKSISNKFQSEYLVHPNLIISTAAKFGLKIISDEFAKNNFKFLKSGYGNFEDIYNEYYPKNEQINLLNKEINKELFNYTKLHNYYIFKLEDNIDSQKLSFQTQEKCKLYEIKVNKLEKMKNFKQSLYIIENNEEIKDYLLRERNYFGSNNIKSTNLGKDNIYSEPEVLTHLSELTLKLNDIRYSEQNTEAFYNTLNYMFEHLKMGIFVKIKNNSLMMFKPFYNINYKNNFKNNKGEFLISLDPKIYANSKDYKEYYDIKQMYGIKEREFSDKYYLEIDKWYANNCIVDNWNTKWSNNFFYEIKSMLYNFINDRNNKNISIPDLEFFINRRDFPILNKEITEPYYDIFNSKDVKIKDYSDQNKKYLPILSFSTINSFLDVPIPTPDDYALSQTGKFIPMACKDTMKTGFTKDWYKKIPTALFRGSATGCGLDYNNNQRIRMSYFSYVIEQERNGIFIDTSKLNFEDSSSKYNLDYITDKKKDDGGVKDYTLEEGELDEEDEPSNSFWIEGDFDKTIHLDSKITSWSKRDRKLSGKYMDFMKGKTLDKQYEKCTVDAFCDEESDNLKFDYPFEASNTYRLDYKEQSKYKYLIYIDGWAAAYRYSDMMMSHSLIFKVESLAGFKLWYFDLLKGIDIEKIYTIWNLVGIREAEIEWKNQLKSNPDHIIIPKYFSLELIKFTIRWCYKYDSDCNKIVENCLKKYTKYLSQEGIYDYLEYLFLTISQKQINLNTEYLKSDIKYPTIFLNDNIKLENEQFKKIIKNKRRIEFKNNITFNNIITNKEYTSLNIEGSEENIENTKLYIFNQFNLQSFKIKLQQQLLICKYSLINDTIIDINKLLFRNEPSINIIDTIGIEKIKNFWRSSENIQFSQLKFNIYKKNLKIKLIKEDKNTIAIYFNDILNNIYKNIRYIKDKYNFKNIIINNTENYIQLDSNKKYNINREDLEKIIYNIFYPIDKIVNINEYEEITKDIKELSKTKLAFILPYKSYPSEPDDIRVNHKLQLQKFIEEINKLFENINYSLFIIEQDEIEYSNSFIKTKKDTIKFNRGALINIGYQIIESYNKENTEIPFTHMIIHDIDLIPNKDIIDNYTKNQSSVLHIASNWDRINSVDGKIIESLDYFGGCISVPINIFKQVGGYPNFYWGWGEEDNCFRKRLIINNIKIEKSNIDKNNYNDLEEISNISKKIENVKRSDQGINEIDDLDLLENKFGEYSNCEQNDFYNIEYNLEDKQHHELNSIYFKAKLNENSFPINLDKIDKIIEDFTKNIELNISKIDITRPMDIRTLQSILEVDNYTEKLLNPLIESILNIDPTKYLKQISQSIPNDILYKNKYYLTFNKDTLASTVIKSFYILSLFIEKLNNVSFSNINKSIVDKIKELNKINYLIFNYNVNIQNFTIIISNDNMENYIPKITNNHLENLKFYQYKHKLYNKLSSSELEVMKEIKDEIIKTFSKQPKIEFNICDPNLELIKTLGLICLVKNNYEDICLLYEFNEKNELWLPITKHSENWEIDKDLDIIKYNKKLEINIRKLYFYLQQN